MNSSALLSGRKQGDKFGKNREKLCEQFFGRAEVLEHRPDISDARHFVLRILEGDDRYSRLEWGGGPL